VNDSRPILLGPDDLRALLTRIGGEIARDHPHGVVLVGVLKGALLFLADLARAIPDVPVEVDFIAISRFAPDSGRVRITQDVQIDIADRDVVIVEDIIDTGLTVSYLKAQLATRNPRTLDVCALLDRESRRIVPEPVRYRGVALEEGFVLGYGLHYRDLYRNLPFVAVGDRDAVREHPEIYVSELYGASATQRVARDGSGEPRW
jgi:hypoxanthine phosphoribosyltransferase